MLTPCQAFKAAFLHRCVEQGLTLEQTHELVKQACHELENPGEKTAFIWPWIKENIPGVEVASNIAGGLAHGMASRLPGLALAGYVGIPAALGGAAGYGISQLEGLNDEDADEIKIQEKIEAYRRAADRAALQQKLHQRRDVQRPKRPML
jgi:hypothetical protein